MNMRKDSAWMKLFKGLFILTFLLVLLYLVKNFDIFNVDVFMERIHAMGDQSKVKIPFVIFTALLLVFFVPISALSGVAALLFELDGILLMTVAGLLGAFASYIIARIYKKNVEAYVAQFYNKKTREVPLEELYERIKEHGFSYALFIRALPFMPFNIGNLLFGVSSISFMDYLTTTLITVALGQGITVFLVAMAADFSSNQWGTLLAVTLKGLYYYFIYYWSKKNAYHPQKELPEEGM